MLAPKRFVQRLKKDNELFRSYMHQVTPCPVPSLCLDLLHRPAPISHAWWPLNFNTLGTFSEALYHGCTCKMPRHLLHLRQALQDPHKLLPYHHLGLSNMRVKAERSCGTTLASACCEQLLRHQQQHQDSILTPLRCCCCALQDAHEFLNYLLNECSELLEKEAKAKRPADLPSAAENADSSSQQEQQQQRQESGQSAESSSSEPAEAAPPKKAAPPPTWIHDLFQVRRLSSLPQAMLAGPLSLIE